MKHTAYSFIRKDLSLAQQFVQYGHALHHAGHLFGNTEGAHLCFFEQHSETDLLNTSVKLHALGIPHVLFREPDIGNQATAIATAPLTPEFKKHFRKFKLYKGD